MKVFQHSTSDTFETAVSSIHLRGVSKTEVITAVPVETNEEKMFTDRLKRKTFTQKQATFVRIFSTFHLCD